MAVRNERIQKICDEKEVRRPGLMGDSTASWREMHAIGTDGMGFLEWMSFSPGWLTQNERSSERAARK